MRRFVHSATVPIYVMAAGVVVILVLLVGLVLLNRHHTNTINEVNAAQCSSLVNLYAVIRKSLEDADKAIDELDYYRLHPLERMRAHERNRETLHRFRNPPCPNDIQIGGRP